MKIVKYLILTLTFIYSAVTIQAESYLSHTMRTTILVSDPEHTLDLISSWADESGGYYLYRSVNRIVIRVQSKDIGKLRSYLEEISEAILDISIETEDLRERLVALRSGIKSREEILQKNLSYLDRTDVKAEIVLLSSTSEGLDALEKEKIDAFTADQVVLIGLALSSEDPNNFTILPDLFSYEPLALALRRNDADFRLIADKVISDLCRSKEIFTIYDKWFGKFSSIPP